MPDLRIADAIARGATLVTPNNRLARDIVTRHDDAQRAAGLSTWSTARAMPWPTFLGDLWQQARDAGSELALQRLDTGQCAHLWRRIVAPDFERTLVDVDAAAALAAEAWEHVQVRGAGGPSWRGFRDAGPDAAAFARWAEAFLRETDARGAIDDARVADALVHSAGALRGAGLRDVVFAGFLDRTPQRARFVDALRAAGIDVDDPDPPPAAPPDGAVLYAAKDARDELACAFAWARLHAQRDPAARIGIVVLDLPQRLAQVHALAEDLLCPALQWPGREGVPRPYEISAAPPLSVSPVVAPALDLIALARGAIEPGPAAVLVRSRYVAGSAERWTLRASVEKAWLEAGVTSLSMPALARSLERFDPALAARWREAHAGLRLPAHDTPRGWAERWRAWLSAAGWCVGTPLDSDAFQAHDAWERLLSAFARLGAVEHRLARDDALVALRRMATATPFQPEGRGARIHVLGVLEAAGLAFDALWVAGVGADAWPRSPSPNPLLPVAWQRERGVPRASPAQELQHARRLTALLSRAARAVVFSYPQTVDDRRGDPSPLIAALPRMQAFEPPPGTARESFDPSRRFERVADAFAPALPPHAPLRGGAGVIDAQSGCPFRAAVLYRLAAREWPQAEPGLAATERGVLVHAALDAFWRDTVDQRTLLALDDAALDAAIARAVDAAIAGHPQERWHALPEVVAAGEAARIGAAVRQWLVAVDRARPPFTVVAREGQTKRRLDLGSIVLDVRFDRLDEIEGGRLAIIDYKSGRATPPAKWFDDRPQAPQLAVYALAAAQDDARPVAVLAYGQLKPGEVKAVGLAADDRAWTGLAVAGDVGLADFDAARAHLADGVRALADEIGRGVAPIAPRDARTCKWCHLKPVCRRQEAVDVDAAYEAAGGNGDG